MTDMRIAICDDDSSITAQLNKFLKSYFRKNHISSPEIICFTNGTDLLTDSGNKDIVFLDIEMPGMNGIYIGNELRRRNKNTLIFIVTAYSEYLDEAMRFHVFRYLSKPIDRQRLSRNLEDALKYYHNISVKIPIETKTGVTTVLSSEIIAVEAQARKVIVHTISDRIESVHNMNYWADLLPQNIFFRTHRSFIINFEFVTDFNHDTVRLGNGKICAYLTKRKYTSFKNAYLLYLESMR